MISHRLEVSPWRRANEKSVSHIELHLRHSALRFSTVSQVLLQKRIGFPPIQLLAFQTQIPPVNIFSLRTISVRNENFPRLSFHLSSASPLAARLRPTADPATVRSCTWRHALTGMRTPSYLLLQDIQFNMWLVPAPMQHLHFTLYRKSYQISYLGWRSLHIANFRHPDLQPRLNHPSLLLEQFRHLYFSFLSLPFPP